MSPSQVHGHYNPSPDGNCGYRALAYAFFQDEEKYLDVKNAMLQFLDAHEHFYKQFFREESPETNPLSGSFHDIRSKLTNDACATDESNWFQFPEMVQLAADTFRRPIASYNPFEHNFTFVPFFNQPDTLRPVALQLYHSHFYCVVVKEKSKPRWPASPPYHSKTCSKFNYTDYSLLFGP